MRQISYEGQTFLYECTFLPKKKLFEVAIFHLSPVMSIEKIVREEPGIERIETDKKDESGNVIMREKKVMIQRTIEVEVSTDKQVEVANFQLHFKLRSGALKDVVKNFLIGSDSVKNYLKSLAQ